MSGFFGIFSRNGKTIDTKIVNEMLEAISYWDPDERRVLIYDSVAFGHATLWNTPESKYEHLPLQKNKYILTMDARIDNREELLNELELPTKPIEEIGDSEFIIAAYKKWGEDCPKHLLGDFAFIIWDEEKQQLFCVRDQVGVKSLYYFVNEEFFIFSNDIKCLLSNNAISKKLNKNLIAIFLRDKGVHTKEETFFEHIKKLPFATSITISCKHAKKKVYWKVNDIKKINYSHHSDYVNELQRLLELSVKARLRTNYPIASHLTGGTDSSPLAAISAKELSKKNKNLYVFNWINVPENEDEYEEKAWKYSREIADHIDNIIHEEFNITPKYMVDMYDNYNVFTDGTTFLWRENYIQTRAHTLGIRTIISGYGGDELISYNGAAYLPGLFYSKNFIKFFQYILSSKKRNPQLGFKVFLKHIIRLLRVYNPNHDSKSSNNIYDSNDYEYIESSFIEYMKKNNYKGVHLTPGIRNDQINSFNYGYLQERIESWGLAAMSKNLEYVYPLLDRRIIEFAVGIPEELYINNFKFDRMLMRRAIEKYLPASIVWSPKEEEIKINKKFKKDYIESLQIWVEKHQNDKIDDMENDIIKYEKILENLSAFDFKKDDVYRLGKIVVGILISNSIKKLKN